MDIPVHHHLNYTYIALYNYHLITEIIIWGDWTPTTNNHQITSCENTCHVKFQPRNMLTYSGKSIHNVFLEQLIYQCHGNYDHNALEFIETFINSYDIIMTIIIFITVAIIIALIYNERDNLIVE